MKLSKLLVNVSGSLTLGLSLSFSVNAFDQNHFQSDQQNAVQQYNDQCTQEEIPQPSKFTCTHWKTTEVLEKSKCTHIWVYDTVTKEIVKIREDMLREGDDRYQHCESHTPCQKKAPNPECDQVQKK